MLPAGFYDDDGRRALVVGLLQPGKVKEKSLCHKNTYLLGKFSAARFSLFSSKATVKKSIRRKKWHKMAT